MIFLRNSISVLYRFYNFAPRAIIMSLLFFLAGCAAAGVAAGPAAPAPSQALLRVGVRAAAPPLIFKQNGQYAGIEADLARALAAGLGKNVSFVECPWNDLIPALLDNRIDIIMSGMTITGLRSVRIAFADPYIRSGQACLTSNKHAKDLLTAESLLFSDLRIGSEKGTTGEFIVQQNLSKAKKVSFADPQKAAKAIEGGRIDLFVHDAPVVWWLASMYEAQGLTALPFFISQEDLAWGVRKDDAALLDSANRFIEAWKQSGQLKALLHRWLPNMF